MVKLTPLLQGLLTEMPLGENGLYLQVFADAFERKPLPTLFLPMPSDPRLLAMTTSLVQNPANDADLDAWANDTGIPRRTLTRRFFKETGLSFAQWRHQMRLLLALEQLAEGETLATVAQKVGYQSVSALIQVFRRALGTTPRRSSPDSSGAPLGARLPKDPEAQRLTNCLSQSSSTPGSSSGLASSAYWRAPKTAGR